MKVKVYSLESGKELGIEADLEDVVFAVPYDNDFMSMHFVRMKKANYMPTNKTKNVSEISGSTKKPYKQKHTGNARQGSTRSAQMRGGGIAFGPRGIKSDVKIPKGEAMLAKAMLLSKAIEDGELFVIQKAQFNSIKTSNAKKVLSVFGQGNDKKNVIIINDGSVDVNSLLAVRNIRGVKFVSNNMLTTHDLLYADLILVDIESVKMFTEVLSLDCRE